MPEIASSRTIALGYHDVIPDGCFGSSGFQTPDADIYKLDVSEFRQHLRIFRSSASDDLRIVFTFDDGGAGGLHAAELLEEFGLRGRFFITTDRLGAPGFLDREGVRELRRRGHVVGSHSCSHPVRMAYCPAEQIDREWRDSIAVLQDILGEDVTTASVPGGYYARAVAASAARAGVRELFTSEPVTAMQTVGGCIVIGRFGVQRGMAPGRFESLVRGDWRPRAEAYVFWNFKKVLKTMGGAVWLRLRYRILAGRAAMDIADSGPRRNA